MKGQTVNAKVPERASCYFCYLGGLFDTEKNHGLLFDHVSARSILFHVYDELLAYDLP